MNHFPERLKAARKMKGYSLQDLVNAMKEPVSKQALSKYEAGNMKPDSKVLRNLCNALGQPVDYFLRTSSIELGGIEFRKQSSLPEKEQTKIKYLTIEFLERYLELEEIMGIDNCLSNPIGNLKIKNEQDVERAAEKLREAWNWGYEPISNIVELLEEKGVKVFQLDAHDAFLGLSCKVNDQVSVIVMNNNEKISIVRKRFTILHELAHLLLDLSDATPLQKEHYCNVFAGAMLMPESIFKKAFGGFRKRIVWPEFILIKEEYGISIAAILYRAKILKLISMNYFKEMMMDYNRIGYQNGEPGQFLGSEQSKRFLQLVLRAYSEDLISSSKAAVLNGQKMFEFRDMLYLMDKK
ncbi:MAG: XRE family transcriptional regulator [Candidatus Pseudobacter hemicellulosilyticus]|uniref:XRE family transcriptional regulator n=1 Tax=Candidatus Pseudobacter hemicellulosilyticus TaxID=3121375 RepID=A0AAJ5WQW1_9BACT|nr:MAG: XRE family transcriptional regulator [Pseudobacter sp.]